MSDIRKPLPPVLEVRVTYSSGTYQTQTVRILLARAIEAGLLHVDRVDAVKRGSPMLIYRAGPKLAAWWRCVA